ncbi:short-chain dehydrogenase [Burkholderiaceae bacterium 26]|nr:short-chain dehydrogenase [Burkholderiaceae bacterium 26]
MSRFSNKTAIVTGAASGIGQAVVEALAREGASVIAADIGFGAPQAAGSVPGSESQVLDVRSEDDVNRLVNLAIARWGHIDLLVNAAGVMVADDVADITDETWHKILDVNLTGAMRLCRAVTPHMRDRGTGSIVNISSVAAFNASAGMASYAASKAGLVALTRALANRYGSAGIRANCVCPGWVRTRMSESEMAEFAQTNGTTIEQEFERVAQRIALGRVALPSEIASCVAFLGSDDASFVTGAVLVADGGARTAATARSN